MSDSDNTFTDENGNTYTITTGSAQTNRIYTNNWYEPKEPCDICKKKRYGYFTYNPTSNLSTKRTICKICYVKANDKFFGIERNIDTEVKLYGE